MFKGKTRKDYPDFFVDERLECKISPIHRLGVFARTQIPNRTLIEASPIIKFHRDTYELLTAHDEDVTANFRNSRSRHILMDYPFGWDPSTYAIALGWGSLYNHSTLSSNVKWKPCKETEALCFYTRCDIEAGEELLIRYLPIAMIDNLWFVEDETEHCLGRIEPGSASFRDLSSTVKKL